MNIYSALRKLAKSTKSQNFFIAAKEVNGVRLFKNSYDFSKLQEFYLSYLFIYDSILRDIHSEGISKEVLNNEFYEDSYLLWKRENRKTKDNKRDVHLVPGKRIKFPRKEVK